MTQINNDNKVFEAKLEKGYLHVKKLRVPHNKDIVSFCIVKNYLFFTDSFIVKCLDLETNKTDIINLNGIFSIKVLSQDEILLIAKDKICICNIETKNVKNLDFNKFSQRNIEDVYVLNENKFKIGINDGCIIVWENGVFSYKKKDIRQNIYSKAKFSQDGKLFVLSHGKNEDVGVKIIHENSTSEDDENCTLSITAYSFEICKSNKYLIITSYFPNVIYDISQIGNSKTMQCFEFIYGLSQKKTETSLTIFFNHSLFDINVVKLIFSFLPTFEPLILLQKKLN